MLLRGERQSPGGHCRLLTRPLIQTFVALKHQKPCLPSHAGADPARMKQPASKSHGVPPVLHLTTSHAPSPPPCLCHQKLATISAPGLPPTLTEYCAHLLDASLQNSVACTTHVCAPHVRHATPLRSSSAQPRRRPADRAQCTCTHAEPTTLRLSPVLLRQ